MIDDAIKLAKQGKPHYIEEQGAKYEGLTVWFNSLVDSAGGGILTKNNKVVVGQSTKIAAQIMHRLADSPAADPGLNVAQEGQSDTALDQGKAAFEINYPFVWSAAQADGPSSLQAHGLRAVPQRRAGHHAQGVDRRLQPRRLALLAASRSSPSRPSGAWSRPRTRARTRSRAAWPPCSSSIYDEPAFDKAYPFHALIKAQLEDYGIRPQTPAYADVTLAIQNALSPTSSIQPEHRRHHAAQRDQAGSDLGGAAMSSGAVAAARGNLRPRAGGRRHLTDRARSRAPAGVHARRAGGDRDAAGHRLSADRHGHPVAAARGPALPQRRTSSSAWPTTATCSARRSGGRTSSTRRSSP